jgi:hypothetical protein
MSNYDDDVMTFLKPNEAELAKMERETRLELLIMDLQTAAISAACITIIILSQLYLE